MNTYEVLLQRESGHNKTVFIHDCWNEQEAETTAESMYGLPVIRVLWKGESKQPEDNSGYDSNFGRPHFGKMLGWFPILVGCAFILFLVQLWLPLAIIGCILAFLAWYGSLDD